jgi:hypothetical protein
MYIDKDGNKFEHIFLFESIDDGYLPGWYYEDETSQLIGPFSTLEEADSELYLYCNEVLGI